VELLVRERADREAGDSGLSKRLEDLDSKIKSLASDHDGNHSSLKDAVANVDRKLRDEMQGLDSKHRGHHQDVRDQLTKGLSDHGNRHSELKDLIAVVSVEEGRARDAHKKDVVNALEVVEKKLRQELANVDRSHSALHEHVGQERQVRENAHATLLDRLVEIEKKSGLPLSGGVSDSSLLEMREIVLNACFKECSQMQETIKQNQQFAAQQFADVNRVLLEEKDLRARDKLEVMGQLRSIYAGMRNHTHEAVTQMAQVASPQVTTRCVSPMPSMRQERYVSPMSTRQSVTVMPPTTTAAYSPTTTQVLSSPAVPLAPVTVSSVTAPSTTSQFLASPTLVRPTTSYVENLGATYISSPQTTGRVATMLDVGTTQYISSPTIPTLGTSMAFAGVDTPPISNYIVMGEDRNGDGIPDVLQGGSQGVSMVTTDLFTGSPSANSFWSWK
jgi:hypothetical protein